MAKNVYLFNAIEDLRLYNEIIEEKYKERVYSHLLSIMKREGVLEEKLTQEKIDRIIGLYFGFGKATREKLEEYLKTGKIKRVEDFRKGKEFEINQNYREILRIPSFGSKKSMELAKKGIKPENIEAFILESSGIITPSQKLGLKHYRFIQRVIPREKKARTIIDRFTEKYIFFPFEIAGSFRRKAKFVNDFDILVEGSLKELKFGRDVVIFSRGEGKIELLFQRKFRIDLIPWIDKEPATLFYFTGSRDFNIKMRGIAKGKGWKLNRYGLFDEKDKKFKLEKERDIFDKLNVGYVYPEDRV
jgi:DNA polymerase (family X)